MLKGIAEPWYCFPWNNIFNTDFTVWCDSHWTTYSSSALH